jgi:hypothetical protein
MLGGRIKIRKKTKFRYLGNRIHYQGLLHTEINGEIVKNTSQLFKGIIMIILMVFLIRLQMTLKSQLPQLMVYTL